VEEEGTGESGRRAAGAVLDRVDGEGEERDRDDDAEQRQPRPPAPGEIADQTREDDQDADPSADLRDGPDDRIGSRLLEVPVADDLGDPQVHPLQPPAGEQVGGHEATDQQRRDHQPPRGPTGRDDGCALGPVGVRDHAAGHQITVPGRDLPVT
jgi:hypothetical protein